MACAIDPFLVFADASVLSSIQVDMQMQALVEGGFAGIEVPGCGKWQKSFSASVNPTDASSSKSDDISKRSVGP